ncbi:MAG TPA: response regulator transcription factor [Verrucomicrobiae bacterium]|jgi:DNA-binding NarL/FixJ family response regulator|nr:response regulator transcription factor [Verrucomicrobiae bacterium]
MPAKSKNAGKRILIVDDHPMMRQGLAQLIDNEPDLKVVAEADTGGQGLDIVVSQTLDMALIDISLPDKNGLELIKDIHTVKPELPILIVSMHDEALYAERVLRAGARGYIMKQEGGKKLLQAIRQILTGQIYVSEKMSARILETFSGRRSEGSSSPVARLSDREFEVFQLIGQGKGTKEIAQHLNLSVKTVEVHRAKIKEKLSLLTATDLVRYAVRWSEVQGPI